jgi:hypothetical protein
MSPEIVVVRQQSKPTDIKCQSCVLSQNDGDGLVTCFMESIKHKWTSPLSACYCEDSFTRKFVNFINARQRLRVNH